VFERLNGVSFLRNRPLVITIILLVVLALLVTATSSSHTFSEGTMVAGSPFVGMQRFFYQVSNNIAGFFPDADTDYREENAALRNELDEYKLRLADYDELVAENGRLAAILEYKRNNENQELKTARVTGKDSGNWFEVFTIDLGSRDGVKANMPVITPDGLVGRVEEVGLNWSKVMSVIDGRSRVSAIMERTRDVGVAGGRIGTDELTAALAMEYLPLDSDIVEGDVVVTSGLDGVFPKGLVIGRVISTASGSAGINATIGPNVDFRHLEAVMIIISSDSTSAVVSEGIADEGAVAAPPDEAEGTAGGEN
jgi:rod shape-determining protein MreC